MTAPATRSRHAARVKREARIDVNLASVALCAAARDYIEAGEYASQADEDQARSELERAAILYTLAVDKLASLG